MEEQSESPAGRLNEESIDGGRLHDLALIYSSLALTPTERLNKLAAYVRMTDSAFLVTKAADRFSGQDAGQEI